jgi:hypothetical protein
MAKPWLTENHSQEFADAIADACLNQYQALPITGKPSVKGTKHEWTILAGISRVQHVPQDQSNSTKRKSNQKDIIIGNELFEISVVALG